ncbi:MAG: hypothetical protein EVA89_01655 [Sandaracinaceae bacterium]|nr:MAG: hypothetical protein EVA89_01655 [Sandaracinaceae bacterium]
MQLRFFLAILTAALVVGCDDDASRDAGGGTDGAVPDGGAVEVDSGPLPDGAAPDGGGVDAGPGDRPIEAHDVERFPNSFGCCGHEINIVVAADRVPHVMGVRDRSGTRSLWYAARTGGTWTETNVTDDGSLPRPRERNTFALAPDGSPHALFSDGATLTYAWLDGTWQSMAVDATSSVGDTFRHFDIAVDAGGAPHVVWFDQTLEALRYGRWNGSAFEVETIDAPAAVDDQSGEFARLALAADGMVHVSFLAIVSGAPVLRHARGTAGSWTVEDVPGMGKGVHGSMLLDSAGNPHIVSADLRSSRARGIYWSAFDGSAWSETELDADSSIVDADADLDPSDRAHVIISNSFGPAGYLQYLYPRNAGRDIYDVRGAVVGDAPESCDLDLHEGTPHVVNPNAYVTFP